MKKQTYKTPHMDVVAIEVNRSLMLVVSATQVNGSNALAPDMDDIIW